MCRLAVSLAPSLSHAIGQPPAVAARCHGDRLGLTSCAPPLQPLLQAPRWPETIGGEGVTLSRIPNPQTHLAAAEGATDQAWTQAREEATREPPPPKPCPAGAIGISLENKVGGALDPPYGHPMATLS